MCVCVQLTDADGAADPSAPDAPTTTAATQVLPLRALSPAERTALDGGVRVGRLLLRLLECVLAHAALLAPAAGLAEGGDLSPSATLLPQTPQAPYPHTHEVHNLARLCFVCFPVHA